jgi:hypothetical protein
MAGSTTSTDFPGATGGAQPTYGGGTDNAFVARLTFSLAAADGLGLSAIVNQPTFAAGQSLNLTAGLINPGLPGAADFYLGVLVPGGTIVFFTTTGLVLGCVTNLASFKPVLAAVSLTTPFSTAAPNLFT